MSLGGEKAPPSPAHTHLVGWSVPGKGSWHSKDPCVNNSALFENFTISQLGRSQAPTKSVCSSTSGTLQAELSLLLKVCIL